MSDKEQVMLEEFFGEKVSFVEDAIPISQKFKRIAEIDDQLSASVKQTGRLKLEQQRRDNLLVPEPTLPMSNPEQEREDLPQTVLFKALIERSRNGLKGVKLRSFDVESGDILTNDLISQRDRSQGDEKKGKDFLLKKWNNFLDADQPTQNELIATDTVVGQLVDHYSTLIAGPGKQQQIIRGAMERALGFSMDKATPLTVSNHLRSGVSQRVTNTVKWLETHDVNDIVLNSFKKNMGDIDLLLSSYGKIMSFSTVLNDPNATDDVKAMAVFQKELLTNRIVQDLWRGNEQKEAVRIAALGNPGLTDFIESASVEAAQIRTGVPAQFLGGGKDSTSFILEEENQPRWMHTKIKGSDTFSNFRRNLELIQTFSTMDPTEVPTIRKVFTKLSELMGAVVADSKAPLFIENVAKEMQQHGLTLGPDEINGLGDKEKKAYLNKLESFQRKMIKGSVEDPNLLKRGLEFPDVSADVNIGSNIPKKIMAPRNRNGIYGSGPVGMVVNGYEFAGFTEIPLKGIPTEAGVWIPQGRIQTAGFKDQVIIRNNDGQYVATLGVKGSYDRYGQYHPPKLVNGDINPSHINLVSARGRRPNERWRSIANQIEWWKDDDTIQKKVAQVKIKNQFLSELESDREFGPEEVGRILNKHLDIPLQMTDTPDTAAKRVLGAAEREWGLLQGHNNENYLKFSNYLAHKGSGFGQAGWNQEEYQNFMNSFQIPIWQKTFEAGGMNALQALAVEIDLIPVVRIYSAAVSMTTDIVKATKGYDVGFSDSISRAGSIVFQPPALQNIQGLESFGDQEFVRNWNAMSGKLNLGEDINAHVHPMFMETIFREMDIAGGEHSNNFMGMNMPGLAVDVVATLGGALSQRIFQGMAAKSPLMMRMATQKKIDLLFKGVGKPGGKTFMNRGVKDHFDNTLDLFRGKKGKVLTKSDAFEISNALILKDNMNYALHWAKRGGKNVQALEGDLAALALAHKEGKITALVLNDGINDILGTALNKTKGMQQLQSLRSYQMGKLHATSIIQPTAYQNALLKVLRTKALKQFGPAQKLDARIMSKFSDEIRLETQNEIQRITKIWENQTNSEIQAINASIIEGESFVLGRTFKFGGQETQFRSMSEAQFSVRQLEDQLEGMRSFFAREKVTQPDLLRKIGAESAETIEENAVVSGLSADQLIDAQLAPEAERILGDLKEHYSAYSKYVNPKDAGLRDLQHMKADDLNELFENLYAERGVLPDGAKRSAVNDVSFILKMREDRRFKGVFGVDDISPESIAEIEQELVIVRAENAGLSQRKGRDLSSADEVVMIERTMKANRGREERLENLLREAKAEEDLIASNAKKAGEEPPGIETSLERPKPSRQPVAPNEKTQKRVKIEDATPENMNKSINKARTLRKEAAEETSPDILANKERQIANEEAFLNTVNETRRGRQIKKRMESRMARLADEVGDVRQHLKPQELNKLLLDQTKTNDEVVAEVMDLVMARKGKKLLKDVEKSARADLDGIISKAKNTDELAVIDSEIQRLSPPGKTMPAKDDKGVSNINKIKKAVTAHRRNAPVARENREVFGGPIKELDDLRTADPATTLENVKQAVDTRTTTPEILDDLAALEVDGGFQELGTQINELAGRLTRSLKAVEDRIAKAETKEAAKLAKLGFRDRVGRGKVKDILKTVDEEIASKLDPDKSNMGTVLAKVKEDLVKSVFKIWGDPLADKASYRARAQAIKDQIDRIVQLGKDHTNTTVTKRIQEKLEPLKGPSDELVSKIDVDGVATLQPKVGGEVTIQRGPRTKVPEGEEPFKAAEEITKSFDEAVTLTRIADDGQGRWIYRVEDGSEKVVGINKELGDFFGENPRISKQSGLLFDQEGKFVARTKGTKTVRYEATMEDIMEATAKQNHIDEAGGLEKAAKKFTNKIKKALAKRKPERIRFSVIHLANKDNPNLKGIIFFDAEKGLWTYVVDHPDGMIWTDQVGSKVANIADDTTFARRFIDQDTGAPGGEWDVVKVTELVPEKVEPKLVQTTLFEDDALMAMDNPNASDIALSTVDEEVFRIYEEFRSSDEISRLNSKIDANEATIADYRKRAALITLEQENPLGLVTEKFEIGGAGAENLAEKAKKILEEKFAPEAGPKVVTEGKAKGWFESRRAVKAAEVDTGSPISRFYDEWIKGLPSKIGDAFAFRKFIKAFIDKEESRFRALGMDKFQAKRQAEIQGELLENFTDVYAKSTQNVAKGARVKGYFHIAEIMGSSDAARFSQSLNRSLTIPEMLDQVSDILSVSGDTFSLIWQDVQRKVGVEPLDVAEGFVDRWTNPDFHDMARRAVKSIMAEMKEAEVALVEGGLLRSDSISRRTLPEFAEFVKRFKEDGFVHSAALQELKFKDAAELEKILADHEATGILPQAFDQVKDELKTAAVKVKAVKKDIRLAATEEFKKVTKLRQQLLSKVNKDLKAGKLTESQHKAAVSNIEANITRTRVKAKAKLDKVLGVIPERPKAEVKKIRQLINKNQFRHKRRYIDPKGEANLRGVKKNADLIGYFPYRRFEELSATSGSMAMFGKSVFKRGDVSFFKKAGGRLVPRTTNFLEVMRLYHYGVGMAQARQGLWEKTIAQFGKKFQMIEDGLIELVLVDKRTPMQETKTVTKDPQGFVQVYADDVETRLVQNEAGSVIDITKTDFNPTQYDLVISRASIEKLDKMGLTVHIFDKSAKISIPSEMMQQVADEVMDEVIAGFDLNPADLLFEKIKAKLMDDPGLFGNTAGWDILPNDISEHINRLTRPFLTGKDPVTTLGRSLLKIKNTTVRITKQAATIGSVIDWPVYRKTVTMIDLLSMASRNPAALKQLPFSFKMHWNRVIEDFQAGNISKQQFDFIRNSAQDRWGSIMNKVAETSELSKFDVFGSKTTKFEADVLEAWEHYNASSASVGFAASPEGIIGARTHSDLSDFGMNRVAKESRRRYQALKTGGLRNVSYATGIDGVFNGVHALNDFFESGTRFATYIDTFLKEKVALGDTLLAAARANREVNLTHINFSHNTPQAQVFLNGGIMPWWSVIKGGLNMPLKNLVFPNARSPGEANFKRLVGMITMGAIMPATWSVYNHFTNPDAEQKLQTDTRPGAQWRANSELHTWFGEDKETGQPIYKALGTPLADVDKFMQLTRLVNNIFKAQAGAITYGDVLSDWANAFLKEKVSHIQLGPEINLLMNKDQFTGKPIFKDDDTLGMKVIKSTAWLGTQFRDISAVSRWNQSTVPTGHSNPFGISRRSIPDNILGNPTFTQLVDDRIFGKGKPKSILNSKDKFREQADTMLQDTIRHFSGIRGTTSKALAILFVQDKVDLFKDIELIDEFDKPLLSGPQAKAAKAQFARNWPGLKKTDFKHLNFFMEDQLFETTPKLLAINISKAINARIKGTNRDRWDNDLQVQQRLEILKTSLAKTGNSLADFANDVEGRGVNVSDFEFEAKGITPKQFVEKYEPEAFEEFKLDPGKPPPGLLAYLQLQELRRQHMTLPAGHIGRGDDEPDDFARKLFHQDKVTNTKIEHNVAMLRYMHNMAEFIRTVHKLGPDNKPLKE